MPTLFTTQGNIPYNERPGSDESYAGKEGRARRIYDLPWTLRWLFCQYAIGFSEARGFFQRGHKNYYIHRVTPLKYPLPFQGLDKDGHEVAWMYATDIERIEGVGPLGYDADNNLIYELARITVAYSSLTYRILEDDDAQLPRIPETIYPDETPQASTFTDHFVSGRYVTRHIQPNAEHLSLPFGMFKWVYDVEELPITRPAGVSDRVANGTGTIIPSAEITYTWHQVPFVPLSIKGETLLGCVNDKEFDGFAKETLLLLATEVRPYRQILGVPAFDIVYKMKYYKNRAPDGSFSNHNRLLHQQFGVTNWEYRRISSDGTSNGTPLYQPVDFSTLFQYGLFD